MPVGSDGNFRMFHVLINFKFQMDEAEYGKPTNVAPLHPAPDYRPVVNYPITDNMKHADKLHSPCKNAATCPNRAHLNMNPDGQCQSQRMLQNYMRPPEAEWQLQDPEVEVSLHLFFLKHCLVHTFLILILIHIHGNYLCHPVVSIKHTFCFCFFLSPLSPIMTPSSFDSPLPRLLKLLDSVIQHVCECYLASGRVQTTSVVCSRFLPS